MLVFLFVLLLLLLSVYYCCFFKCVTPITVFIFMAIAYSFAPVFFDTLDYHFYEVVISKYQVFGEKEFYTGFVILVVTIIMFIIFERISSKPLANFYYRLKRLRSQNKLVVSKLFLSLCYVLSIIFICISFLGIKIFGVATFFGGYSDSSLSHSSAMTLSPGWSLYTNGAMWFYMLSALILMVEVNKNRRYALFIIISIFALVNLMSGARLITLTGLITIYFSYHGFILSINKKTILSALSIVVIFAFVGIYRGGGAGVDWKYSLLEFAFVGFGFYQIIASKEIYDVYIFEFLYDVCTSMLPAYFFDKDNIYRTELVMEFLGSARALSPIGGNYFLTDLYLYLGIFSVVFVMLSLFVVYIPLNYLSRLKLSNFSVLVVGVYMWFFTYVFLWFVRNQLLSSASLISKIMAVTLLLLMFSMTNKIYLQRRRCDK